jgi:hypothetical protein
MGDDDVFDLKMRKKIKNGNDLIMKEKKRSMLEEK